MKHYLEQLEAVFSHIGSSNDGLSSQEAASRLEKNGANRLAEPPKVPLWKKFLMQFAFKENNVNFSDPQILHYKNYLKFHHKNYHLL